MNDKLTACNMEIIYILVKLKLPVTSQLKWLKIAIMELGFIKIWSMGYQNRYFHCFQKRRVRVTR